VLVDQDHRIAACAVADHGAADVDARPLQRRARDAAVLVGAERADVGGLSIPAAHTRPSSVATCPPGDAHVL
jgi:hypothetical protein